MFLDPALTAHSKLISMPELVDPRESSVFASTVAATSAILPRRGLRRGLRRFPIYFHWRSSSGSSQEANLAEATVMATPRPVDSWIIIEEIGESASDATSAAHGGLRVGNSSPFYVQRPVKAPSSPNDAERSSRSPSESPS